MARATHKPRFENLGTYGRQHARDGRHGRHGFCPNWANFVPTDVEGSELSLLVALDGLADGGDTLVLDAVVVQVELRQRAMDAKHVSHMLRAR